MHSFIINYSQIEFDNMNLEFKPRKFGKLAPGCKVVDFEVHKDEPLILIASSQNKLESHYVKNTGQIDHTKLLPVKSLNTNWIPQMFSFSGKQNIVYNSLQSLVINNKGEIKHKHPITNLLVDEYQVALTTAKDIITVSSTQKAQVLAEMHAYGEEITAVFWHNSLVIAGQAKGSINVWDINKQKVKHKNSFNVQKINLINSYVDYIHTNIYYSLATAQKRLMFNDMRTYKPIKIVNNISSGVKTIKHNASGKIFIMNEKDIEIIDLYQGFDVLGKFGPIKKQKLEEFTFKHPQAVFQQRNLNDLLVQGKFVVTGCSNGCIQVYNSDTMECEYGFGLSEFSGITKLRKLNNSIIGLQSKGFLNMIEYN